MIETLSIFPTINAILNGTSAVLLYIGHGYIKRGDMQRHKRLMISAFVSSTLFLASYLTYHYLRSTVYGLGPTPFPRHDWSRYLYFAVLLSHTILAVAIVPLVLITLTRALRGRFDKHRAIARWTYPIWMYVSVTGVLIYLMLYQIFKA
jgi:putative membrane protein